MASDKRVVQIFRRAVNKAKNINRLVKPGSSVEGFFASKGAAYAIPDGDFARKASLKGGEIQSHLQGMVNLIRDEDTMRLVVKVESEAKYTRYLSIVTTHGLTDEEESVVLGFDWIEDEVTLGLVIPLWSNVSTKLDGDGGFEIKTEQRSYGFKPVSVQTLWTALLWIHKCIKTAHRAKHFNGGVSHAWLDYYQSRILSPQECINFWKSMDQLENKREICFSYFDKVKTDEELLKGSIRNKLKEILTRFDLEEVTCRQVREALEAEMKMSLQHIKGYVDEQVFVILGQMESSTKITENLYLGSEWNACNLEELKENGVEYILNITKEVDNFFPGTFNYMNIRLYDVKDADLLCHWEETYHFLHKAKKNGSAALVHCRRGISRSASTVIAYLMKEDNLALADAMKFVKSKRSIVQPNSGFWKQLIVYEGILRSSRNRHNSLFRLRSNSADSSKIRRPHHKKGRQKKDADQVDNAPEHAHTLPRMGGEIPLEDRDEGMESCDVTNRWKEGDPLDLVSSCEDISSNSDEESPSNAKLKIRRTVSEPVMMRADDVMMMSPTRESRARTFTEPSSTRIAEDQEDEDDDDDGVWMKSEDVADIVHKEGEMSHEDLVEPAEPMTECLVVASGEAVESKGQSGVTRESIEIVNVSAEPDEETSVHNTRITEQLTSTGETEPIEVLDNVKQVPCEESLRVDSPCEVVDSPREESAGEDNATPPRTPRQRSRSIGEKLVDKCLIRQGRSESSDNLKKVNIRGRVRRRERKAKSDLQLSSSGFVKRHTQIIEEQMLYSLLMNSDDTLATLDVDYWEKNGDSNSNTANSNCETQSSPTNVDLESKATLLTTEEISEKHLEESGEVFEKKSEFCCSFDNLELPDEDKQDHSKHEPDPEYDQNSEQNLPKRCQSNPENISGKQCLELQNIVQEVNAEAKRDIAAQPDATKPLVVSQDALRHAGDCDHVTIDRMTWIDLTHHHGDVVKRRSAAFENTAKQGPKASLPQSRDKLLTSTTCQEREQIQGNRTDVNTKSEVVSHGTNKDIPKLDLADLMVDESSVPRSNSIIVEDYNSWESSSVRDRTKILENIIAKTGGSFPSPRSKVRQAKLSNSEVEGQLPQQMGDLFINPNSEVEKEVICHHSYGEDQESSSIETSSEQPGDNNVFGDAPVRSLVDKFEDWG